jgi:lysylphosphatidylglycerol synthetase-like protein (DUF2156 family)
MSDISDKINTALKIKIALISILVLLITLFMSGGVADNLQNLYKWQSGHWLVVVAISLISGAYCSGILALLYLMRINKDFMGAMATLLFVGGALIPIMNDISDMTSSLAVGVTCSILLAGWGIEEFREDNKRITDRLKKEIKK